jgi:hypothetical protein
MEDPNHELKDIRKHKEALTTQAIGYAVEPKLLKLFLGALNLKPQTTISGLVELAKDKRPGHQFDQLWAVREFTYNHLKDAKNFKTKANLDLPKIKEVWPTLGRNTIVVNHDHRTPQEATLLQREWKEIWAEQQSMDLKNTTCELCKGKREEDQLFICDGRDKTTDS